MNSPGNGAANVLLDYTLTLRKAEGAVNDQKLNAVLQRLTEVGAVDVIRDKDGDFSVNIDGLIAGCVALVDKFAELAAAATQETTEQLLEAVKDMINMPPDPFR